MLPIEHLEQAAILHGLRVLAERRSHKGCSPPLGDALCNAFAFLGEGRIKHQLGQMLEVSQKLTKKVTIYSHSLDNALVLSGKEGVDFHLLGGRFYSKNRFYYSLHEAQLLQHLQFDLAFFGAASLSQGVVSYEDEEDVAVKQLAMQAARTKILIAESDKYEKHSKYILGKIEDFDYWITDKKPDPDLVETLKDKVMILYDGKDNDYE